MALTASDGNLIETYEYDVFGMPDITQYGYGATNNRFLFAGYGWDAETVLYNYDDVAYDPLIGWITQGRTYYQQTEEKGKKPEKKEEGCCCKRIIVKDSPKNAGLGKEGLGVITDTIRYGFHVRIEAAVTGSADISKCEITQDIFMQIIIYDSSWKMRDCIIFDGSHQGVGIPPVTEEECNKVTGDWTWNKESFQADITNDDLFSGNKDWNKHGRDWVEYSDHPGHKIFQEPEKEDWKHIRQRLTVRIGCKGTDGREITARFWLTHSVIKEDKKWISSNDLFISPELGTGKIWE